MHKFSTAVKDRVGAYVVSSVAEEKKIELLDNLSIAVEKIQNEFDNPLHNKLVRDGKTTRFLCACLEDIFQHGLREKLFQSSATSPEQLAFWAVIQKLSIKEDIQTIYRLSIIQTDTNRCRAWIKMKLKDHTIGSYIGLLTDDTKLLREYYGSMAFLKDTVKVESVKTLLQYVIANLDFQINLEGHQSLPKTPSPSNSNSPGPVIDESKIASPLPAEAIRRRKSSKKRAKTPTSNIARIKDFDEANTLFARRSSLNSQHSAGSTSLARPASAYQRAHSTEPRLENTKRESLAKRAPNFDTRVEQVETLQSHSAKPERPNVLSLSRPGVSQVESTTRRELTQQQKEEIKDILMDLKLNINRPLSVEKILEVLPRQDGLTEKELKDYLDDFTSDYFSKGIITNRTSKSLNKPKVGKIIDFKTMESQGNHEPEVTPVTGSFRPVMASVTGNFEPEMTSATGNFHPEVTSSTGNFGTEVASAGKSKAKNAKENLEIGRNGNVCDEIEGKGNLDIHGNLISFVDEDSSQKTEDVVKICGLPVSCKNLSNQDPVSTSKIGVSDCSVGSENNSSAKSCTSLIDSPVEQLTISPKEDSEREANLLGTVKSHPFTGHMNEDKASDVTVGDSLMCHASVDNYKSKTPEDSVLRHENSEIANNIVDQDCLSGPVNVGNANTASAENSLLQYANSKHFESNSTTNEHALLQPANSNDNIMTDDHLQDTVLDEVDQDKTIESDVKSSDSSPSIIKLQEGHSTDQTQTGASKDGIEDNSIGNEAKLSENEANAPSSVEIEDDDFNFVPGIYEEPAFKIHSKTRPIQNKRANTIGAVGRNTSHFSPLGGPSRSLGSEASNRAKQKSSISSDTQELLYGFRVNSPSLDSPHSSLNTTQGLMFNDENYTSDSETDTFDSAATEEKERIRNILADLGVNDDIVGLKEDHFATPDTFMGFTSGEELQNAIETCKDRIKSLPSSSEDRKQLVRKLVQLRLKLHEQKEEPSDSLPHVKKILGHQFAKQGKAAGNYFCDCCGSTIWAFMHTLYKCIGCSFYAHKKCLSAIDKPCVSKKVSGSMYITDIAPESGLSTQQYRCADCRRRLVFKEGYFQARNCDYTGQFYCSNCHWNEAQVMPARVIHNWDFMPRKVSRQSKHLLNLLSGKPIICLKELNPALFNFVEDLRDVNSLREQILTMKSYLMSCRLAVQEKLLLLLKERQHFVENSDTYTLQDLIGVYSGELLEDLSRITATFGKHIKFDCVLCQGKGFICEICRSSDVIFPFDFNSQECEVCQATFHRACLRRGECPKCIRIAQRKDKR